MSEIRESLSLNLTEPNMDVLSTEIKSSEEYKKISNWGRIEIEILLTIR